MAIKITNKEFKRVDLVEVGGRVDSSTAPQLENVLNQIMNNGRYHIVIDLANTDFMSSAGLRVLLATLKQARRFNRGDVRLAAMPAKIKKAFNLAGLDELFSMFDDPVDAVASF
jgi:anti-sigma B factor antagonist